MTHLFAWCHLDFRQLLGNSFKLLQLTEEFVVASHVPRSFAGHKELLEVLASCNVIHLIRVYRKGLLTPENGQ